MKFLLKNWALSILGCLFVIGFVGCNSGEDPKKPGESEHPAPEIEIPTSGSDAIAKLNAALKAVEEAGTDKLDEAAYHAEAKFLAIADYLAETESPKILDIVAQTKVKGLAQSLRIQGQKLHELAHENADDRDVIDALIKDIKRQIKNLSDLL